MDTIMTLLLATQVLCLVFLIGQICATQRGQCGVTLTGAGRDQREEEELKRMRRVHLTPPLSEQMRPQKLEEIVGQAEGIRALQAALCGPNPQHVLIYGPPGVGKTAAARLMLEVAKASAGTPFQKDAVFVELDATTLRFDERSITDPLLGSVHDPIYQGAGAYGALGIPKPQPGAVTKAHGGVLFLDEIGELHPVQMNKLLKVLEDRKIMPTSSYYQPYNKNIPSYIHDIFRDGFPADFRLVGATTRSPEEIPPALRSRCTEIFFRNLSEEELEQIASDAAAHLEMVCQKDAIGRIGAFARNGRDVTNLMQTAGALARMEERTEITVSDVDWVAKAGHYAAKPCQQVTPGETVGRTNALAVGSFGGVLLPLEVWAEKGSGKLQVTGMVAEEELDRGHSKLRRNSMAMDSVQTVLTVLKREYQLDAAEYDIHIHFSGGMPVDGPSAGVALFLALYSAVTKVALPNVWAATGEVSLEGEVLPVGGVQEKVEAAAQADAQKVFVPKNGFQESWLSLGVEVIAVERVEEVLQYLQQKEEKQTA